MRPSRIVRQGSKGMALASGIIAASTWQERLHPHHASQQLTVFVRVVTTSRVSIGVGGSRIRSSYVGHSSGYCSRRACTFRYRCDTIFHACTTADPRLPNWHLHCRCSRNEMAAERIRVTFTKDQLSKYFERLHIPEDRRHHDVTKLKNEDALKYLALLQKHHLAAVPFENLTLHYSTHRQVSVHPEALFKKIIADNNGRGGYCMENNCLFGTLLFSLGFNIYSGGARVWAVNAWTGWSHMVNLVTIGDTKYHVDVAFGSDGPVVPMPLDRSGTVQPHIRPAMARLQWGNIPGNTDPAQRLWVYEHRINDDADWVMKYCYTELEFLPSDYNLMNYFTSTSHKTFFTRMIVVDKKLLDEDGEYKGSLIVNGNTMKWRIHGVKEREIEFKTDAERLDALEKYFDIRFDEAERDGISGLASQLG
jgi:arylamine N-acetyltransferase